MTAARTARHQRLSAFLASRSNVELAELVGAGRVISVGVGGGAALIDVDSVPVFTNRILLTDREVADSGSAPNLFDRPMFCQYGIGGPSFNAWRELAANIIVTDAVLPARHNRSRSLYLWAGATWPVAGRCRTGRHRHRGHRPERRPGRVGPSRSAGGRTVQPCAVLRVHPTPDSGLAAREPGR